MIHDSLKGLHHIVYCSEVWITIYKSERLKLNSSIMNNACSISTKETKVFSLLMIILPDTTGNIVFTVMCKIPALF